MHNRYKYSRPTFGAKIQYAQTPNNSLLTKPSDTRYIQSVTCTFIYYSQAIDPTMIVALNNIASVQFKPTLKTLKKCYRLMDYAATYPNAKLCFFARVIWSCTLIRMLPTLSSLMLAAELQANTSSAIGLLQCLLPFQQESPMHLSWWNVKPYTMWWPPLRRWKLAAFSTMAKW